MWGNLLDTRRFRHFEVDLTTLFVFFFFNAVIFSVFCFCLELTTGQTTSTGTSSRLFVLRKMGT